MTIPLTGAGSFGVRLGHLFGFLQDLIALHGGTASARVLAGASAVTRLATIEADYAAGTALYNTIDGFGNTMATWNFGGVSSGGAGAEATVASAVATLAQNTMIAMAQNDQALLSLTLAGAVAYLQAQMTANATSINASTVTIGAQTNGTPAPQGNPVIVVTNFLPNGLLYQTTWPETLTAKCTADSLGSATLNQEPIQITGQVARPAWDYRWPGGSACNVSFNLCDAGVNNSGNNLLYNGEFITWSNGSSGAPPDNWKTETGAAQISKDTTDSYYSTDPSMLFTGDSATLTAVSQAFNTAASAGLGTGGTPAKIAPSTLYVLNFWFKLTNASPAAGVLKYGLVQTNGTTFINDDQGVANSSTTTLTTVADTNWHNVNLVIRCPFNMVTAQKIRIGLSTALTTGTNIAIARVSLMKAVQLYPMGPWVAGFSGSTKAINGITPDNWTFAITNTMGLFAQYLEQAFGMRNLGAQLPYSGSPTIADSLIA